MIKDHGLVGPDWICQKEVEFKDPDTGKTYRRKLDAFNTRTKQILEIKSNGSPDRREIPKDLAWAKDPNWKDSRAKFVFAEPQKADAKKFLGDMRQIAGDRVTEYNYRSDRVELAPKGGQRATSGLLEPPGQSGTTRGGATDLIRESRPTPKDMAEYLNRRNVANPGGLPRGPGGVDFSTLDLKYIGKPVKGKGVDFAFDANEDPTEKSGWGGKAKAQLISDAFFTWLALSPDKFWVNLNPDEPDRIMDAKFGKTDSRPRAPGSRSPDEARLLQGHGPRYRPRQTLLGGPAQAERLPVHARPAQLDRADDRAGPRAGRRHLHP